MQCQSLLILGASLSMALLQSCRRETDYERALKSGERTIPSVVAFERVFPGSVHYISDYNVKGRPRAWRSETFLYGRYEFGMEIPDIQFDPKDTRVVVWGKPIYVLLEYASIDVANRGGGIGEQHTFGPDDWKKLEAAGGDFSALGVTLKKHAPVPGIEMFEHKE